MQACRVSEIEVREFSGIRGKDIEVCRGLEIEVLQFPGDTG